MPASHRSAYNLRCSFVVVASLFGPVALAQPVTCTELARVGWYEYESSRTEDYFLYNLVKQLRTERYRDFGIASKLLGSIGLPIADFLAPFSLSASLDGWAKFHDVEESFLYKRLQTYSSAIRNKISINPAVVDLVKTCLQQDGIFITLGQNTNPSELRFLLEYRATPGIDSVTVRLSPVAGSLICPKRSYRISYDQRIAFTCRRRDALSNAPAGIDFNTNRSRIRTDQSWSLPGPGSSASEELADTRKVTFKQICFATRNEGKDDDTVAYVSVDVDGLQYAHWGQLGKIKFEQHTNSCFALSSSQPMPLAVLQSGTVKLHYGISSVNGDDTWEFEPVLSYMIDGEASPREARPNAAASISENEAGKPPREFVVPKQVVGPPPAVQVKATAQKPQSQRAPQKRNFP